MAKNKAKMNKFLTGAITATMVATAVAPVAALADEQKIDFSDVSKDSSHYPNIIKAAERGLMTGYQGKFNPLAEMSRGQVVKALGKYLVAQEGLTLDEYLADKGLLTKVTPFNDVPANVRDQELFKYSLVVKDAEAFTGNKNNLLAQNNITREQMSKVLVNAFNLKSVAGKDANVADMNLVQAQYQSYVTVLSQHEITKADDNNYRPKGNVTRQQMASFLNRAYDVVHGADKENPAISSVKAINNTTVEVTFKETIKDIKALDFAIEGLTVSNAVVKQSDKKTAILTTSAQEGGKKYTVTEGGKALGTFEGISAVIPSSVDVTSNSTQAVVGKEVTVSAKVTVPAGQSKAGIPVTFNIQSDNIGNNEGQIKEVYTDADGVATFSYTQYYGGQDTVVAYATGDPSVRSKQGQVYWGEKQLLALTEVTQGNQLVNGAKKVYKVAVNNPDGTPYNGEVNIAFEENVNVTQDKAVKGVAVTDAKVGQNQFPHQFTSGTNRVNPVTVQLTNGEATFTLSGSDVNEVAKVTPIVFLDNVSNANGKFVQAAADGKLASTELQMKAPTLSFEATQELEVVVESIGTKDAAASDGTNLGGRDYKATVRDKDGKLAPEGTIVYVAADKLEGPVNVYQGKDNEGSLTTAPWTNSHVELETDKNGEVEFTLVGAPDAYAVPIVYHNNGDTAWRIDDADAQAKGEIVYFGKAVLKTAVLTVLDKPQTDPTAKEITSLPHVDNNDNLNTAYFVYEVTDQNGKKNTTLNNSNVTFQVKNTGFSNSIDADTASDSQTIPARQTKSVTGKVINGVAVLEVVSENGAAGAEVDVTSSQITLTGGKGSVAFTKGTSNNLETPANNVEIDSIDKDKKTVVINGKNAISYAPADATINNLITNDSNITEGSFEAVVDNNDTVVVNVSKDPNGKYIIDIIEVENDDDTALTLNDTGNNDNVVNAAEYPAAQLELELTSTAVVGDVVELHDTTNNIIATKALDLADVNAGQLTITVGNPGLNLPDGQHTLTVKVIDGNTAKLKGEDTVIFTVAQTLPDEPEASRISDVLDGDNKISGTHAKTEGMTINVYDSNDIFIGSSPVAANGTWSVDLDTPAQDGHNPAWTYHITVTDAYGNESVHTEVTVQ